MPLGVSARMSRMAGEAHVAAMEGRWGDLEDLIRRQPQVASEIRDSRLPLHDAVRQERAPAHILRALIDANPSGVQALTKYGNLPIHLAALVKADFDVVDMLIKHHPKDCLMEVNGFGNTPLHHAVSTSPGLPYRPTGVTHAEYVQRFLQACPEAALVENCQGQLPLHLAMESAEGGQAHLDVVRCLIECYPASIRMPDADGRLALHHLLAMNANATVRTLDVVRYLVEVYPESTGNITPIAGSLLRSAACCRLDDTMRFYAVRCIAWNLIRW